MTIEATKLNEFLVAHGGPFYELQRHLGLLREDAMQAGQRAVIFIGLTWGVPLILSIIAGNAWGSPSAYPYLFYPVVWARFFIAIGLFTLMEQQVEKFSAEVSIRNTTIRLKDRKQFIKTCDRS